MSPNHRPCSSTLLPVLITCAALMVVLPSPSQASVTFSELGAGLPGIFYGVDVWGDYDADGDLDLLIAGDTGAGLITRVYRFTGAGFVNAGFTMAGASFCDGDWGDYDGDNDLDILLSGRDDTGAVRTWIYRNSGAFGFIEVPNSLPGLTGYATTWVDYDNDGDLDIFISGMDQTNARVTVLARNDGGDIFTIVPDGFPDLLATAASWGDYDHDGDLDLVLLGAQTGIVRRTLVYRNDGDGVFTDIQANLTPVAFGAVAWGDYDCDGDLDLVVGGSTNEEEPATSIYRNDGADTFTDIGAGIPGLMNCSFDWGDFDNNGTLDLFATGKDIGNQPLTRLYQNNGAGVFTEAAYSFRDLGEGEVNWGDYDADGDLDFVLSGRAVGAMYTTVYRSSGGTPNQAPAPPGNLTSTIVGDKVRLSWTPSTDDVTPAGSLTYNLRVGTTSGGSQIMSAMALSGGRRLIQALGNAQEETSWLVDVRGVRYYWTVQAIDAAYAGSSFPTERTVNLSGITEDQGVSATRIGAISPNPSSGAVRIPIELQAASDVRLAIYDASGRRIRVLERAGLGAGSHGIDWDGRDDEGNRVAPGFYLCHMQAGSVARSRAIVRLD